MQDIVQKTEIIYESNDDKLGNESIEFIKVYNEFSDFLKWRKRQPAMMAANNMTKPSGGSREIIFERRADKQNLRCIFDFDQLTAEFKEV